MNVHPTFGTEFRTHLSGPYTPSITSDKSEGIAVHDVDRAVPALTHSSSTTKEVGTMTANEIEMQAEGLRRLRRRIENEVIAEAISARVDCPRAEWRELYTAPSSKLDATDCAKLAPSTRFRYDGPSFPKVKRGLHMVTSPAELAMRKRIARWNDIAAERDEFLTELGRPPLRWCVLNQLGATLEEGVTEAGRDDSLALALDEVERGRAAWDERAWLTMNPTFRAGAGRELWPVDVDVLIPCSAEDEEVGENGASYRWLTVEVFTETGCSPWDADQWRIDHPDDDGVDARIAEMAGEVRTPGRTIRTTIEFEGELVETSHFVPERPWAWVDVNVDENGKRRYSRKASGAARRNYLAGAAKRQAARVETIAESNRKLLIEELAARGIDPRSERVVAWVNAAKAKARGRDGVAYSRCIFALQAKRPLATA